MDLDSTIEAVANNATESVTYVIQGASNYIPDQISQTIRHAYLYFPTKINLADAAQFILYFAAAALIMGVLGRVFLGKRSSLNHSLSAVMAISFVYAATIIVYTFQPLNFESYLSPLPFVTFSGDYMIVLPIADLEFRVMCQHILSLIILAFLVNLTDSAVPQGENVIGWYVLRLACVLLSMGLHYLVSALIRTCVPDLLATYAAAILLAVLVFMLFSGLISLALGMVIAVGNPFLGTVYSFFFSNIIGKQLSKAVFSSVILCGVFYLLDLWGYTIICINSAVLVAFLPLLLVLLALWYLIGHVL